MIKSNVRPRGTDKAELVKVIKTTSIIGSGNEKDPVRHITQYWDLEGKLLASHETLDESQENIYTPTIDDFKAMVNSDGTIDIKKIRY